MLPETSLLPLLQPPSIEFINTQFESVANSSSPSQNDSVDEKEDGHLLGREVERGRIKAEDIHMENLENYPIRYSGLHSQHTLYHHQIQSQQYQQQYSHHLPRDVIIQVECGHNIGYMNLSRLCQGSKGSCIFYNGLQLTPNEFQFISGRETAKDWKRSIRHNGKSLKLLIKRKLLSVHSSSCECFLTNKITPMEDSISNDEEHSPESGKSSPIESMKLSSIINKMKTSLGAAENGGDDEKSPSTGNNSSGLNLNEKPSKRRRKDGGGGGGGGGGGSERGERSSPSESVQSDSEIGIKRSPPPPHHRNYSDFMRSLAAKYNHLPVEPTIPQNAAALFSRQQLENNRFLKQSLIDMSSTTALLQLVRSADLKKYHQTPLDLTSSSNISANGPINNNNNNNNNNDTIRKDSSCCYSQEVTAILNWSVDDVCRFVSSIDLCKEHTDSFRSQCIDGSGLPLLTEEHLIAMGMKLGPALKFLSVLKRKLGNCIVCQHCPQCHHHNTNNNSSSNPSINATNLNNNNIIQ